MTRAAAVDGVRLRRGLGEFATGVTVVTTRDGDRVRGMTANAFTSVSMDPPTVLVSVAATATLHGCIVRAGRFGVSVLAADRAEDAMHFAGRPARAGSIAFDDYDRVPVLTGGLLQMACAVSDTVPAGDHTLFLGAVESFRSRHGRPLVFFEGQFRDLCADPLPDPWWL